MKKNLTKLLVLILTLTAVFAFTACGSDSGDDGQGEAETVKIGVPNDPTNESRALKLLETQGLITLPEEDNVEYTVRDIVENTYNIEFSEIEAAQLPNVLQDLDYAVINSNYAIEAGITPFVTEGTDVSYPNIIAVKEGNESSDKIKALVAAINSEAVQTYINDTYKGAIVCDLVNPGNGFDDSVDYAALAGTTITVAASPTPHADILAVAKDVLAEKDITLDVKEFNDYIVPNQVVESGEVDANYFQHIPYMENFNAENGTHLLSVLEVHHEPMGIYSDTYTDLSKITG